MGATFAHTHDHAHWDADERLRFSRTVGGIFGLSAAMLQLLVLGASALIRDALPFVIAGQTSSVSQYVLRSGSSPLFLATVIVIDIALFWAMYRLAARKGAGMMFVPVLFYLATAVLIGWLAVMPVHLAITLSQ